MNISSLKTNFLGKFKAKRPHLNLNLKNASKMETNKDYINFTPKSRDMDRDTSLEFKAGLKKGYKPKYKLGDRKGFSGGIGAKGGKSKNLSVMSKKCRRGC